MPDTLRLPMLGEILPGGLTYGANYLVEFEPNSVWYETSLTFAADALRNGIRADYHTFTHLPADVRSALLRLGLDLERFERNDTFRIWDSYTLQTGAGEPERVGKASPRDPVDIHTLDLNRWTEHDLAETSRDIPEVDTTRLHLDDDTSILVQFNDEKSFVTHWRTQTIPYARRHRIAAFHSIVKGVYSDVLYRQFESFCDGILEFKSEEGGGTVNQLMRVRLMRGQAHDSSWHRLRLTENGEVVLSEIAKPEVAEERRLAAIMFSDMVGYTALAQTDESHALELLEVQTSVVRSVLHKYKGREVKTMGDSFLVEFGSALDAAKCAVEIQRTIHDRNQGSAGDQIHLRIGLHVGDVVGRGEDVFGDAVNIASRIEPLAEPGGICLSRQVYDQIRNKVPYEVVELGERGLKGVRLPLEVYRLTLPWSRGSDPRLL